MALAPDSRLGSYHILAKLGEGGMGEVYRATDTRLDREVAIKVLPAAMAGDAGRLALFEREARTVARLSHPNIVVIYSVEEAEGVPFITMELVEGRDLSQVVTPGGLALARVLDLVVPLADAIAAAHEQGVTHRDLKPANVMVTHTGRVKVLDFGIAKPVVLESETDPGEAATVTAPVSAAGRILGTVPYMAPEQLRGGATDARTDLFALGVLLYELLTGRRPFQGPTTADISSAILRDQPAPLTSIRADAPAALERIIARCLEKDPERRIQTAKDVRNELELVRRALDTGVTGVIKETASVAVLPFVNHSREKDDEYFADGITEDVIAHLAKVRTLKVISRTSVMSLKERDEGLREIAARLEVGHLLEGSVRRAGDRVRIVAQLIDAASGRHIWADTYDRRLTDIFVIQTDVAIQIAAALKAELSPGEHDRLNREPTQDLQAYEHYLRGRHGLAGHSTNELLRGIDQFNAAIDRDRDFALAHVGLAMALTQLVEFAAGNPRQVRASALSAAARAIELDPDLGEAYCARAYARMVFELDWTGAEEDFRRSLDLNPNNSDAYDLYGRLCAGIGRFGEAITLHERAHELDPLTHRVDIATSLLRAGRYEDAEQAATRAARTDPHDARVHATLGWAFFQQGRHGEGITELERATNINPSEDMWLAQLGEAYGLAGQPDKAREVLRRLEDSSRPVPAAPYYLAYVYTGLGDEDRAFDCLERALAEGSGSVFGIKGSFLLAPLRQHPRFAALLGKMGLAATH